MVGSARKKRPAQVGPQPAKRHAGGATSATTSLSLGGSLNFDSDADSMVHTDDRGGGSSGPPNATGGGAGGTSKAAKDKQRREKNRIAARKCRAKKINFMTTMEQQVAEMRARNEELQVQLATVQRLYTRDVHLREALKVVISAVWNRPGVAPLFGNMTAEEFIVSLESGGIDVNALIAAMQPNHEAATATHFAAPLPHRRPHPLAHRQPILPSGMSHAQALTHAAAVQSAAAGPGPDHSMLQPSAGHAAGPGMRSAMSLLSEPSLLVHGDGMSGTLGAGSLSLPIPELVVPRHGPAAPSANHMLESTVGANRGQLPHSTSEPMALALHQSTVGATGGGSQPSLARSHSAALGGASSLMPPPPQRLPGPGQAPSPSQAQPPSGQPAAAVALMRAATDFLQSGRLDSLDTLLATFLMADEHMQQAAVGNACSGGTVDAGAAAAAGAANGSLQAAGNIQAAGISAPTSEAHMNNSSGLQGMQPPSVQPPHAMGNGQGGSQQLQHPRSQRPSHPGHVGQGSGAQQSTTHHADIQPGAAGVPNRQPRHSTSVSPPTTPHSNPSAFTAVPPSGLVRPLAQRPSAPLSYARLQPQQGGAQPVEQLLQQLSGQVLPPAESLQELKPLPPPGEDYEQAAQAEATQQSSSTAGVQPQVVIEASAQPAAGSSQHGLANPQVSNERGLSEAQGSGSSKRSSDVNTNNSLKSPNSSGGKLISPFAPLAVEAVPMEAQRASPPPLPLDGTVSDVLHMPSQQLDVLPQASAFGALLQAMQGAPANTGGAAVAADVSAGSNTVVSPPVAADLVQISAVAASAPTVPTMSAIPPQPVSQAPPSSGPWSFNAAGIPPQQSHPHQQAALLQQQAQLQQQRLLQLQMQQQQMQQQAGFGYNYPPNFQQQQHHQQTHSHHQQQQQQQQSQRQASFFSPDGPLAQLYAPYLLGGGTSLSASDMQAMVEYMQQTVPGTSS